MAKLCCEDCVWLTSVYDDIVFPIAGTTLTIGGHLTEEIEIKKEKDNAEDK